MVTREQAIEFCQKRKEMHLIKANKVMDDNVKYNANMNLADIYDGIVELLEGKDDKSNK
jgi:hypothetical protein